MSDTENPIHASLAQPKRPADGNRVRLCQGPTIDPATMAQLLTWHRIGISYGVIIDRLVTHATTTGFDPAK
jgi:hypothetical protein